VKDVTICVMSCGELTEKKCIKAIEPFLEQGCPFQRVTDVFPQSKALNQMIEQCDTPWLIPVDADIILYPNAWDRISNAWRKHWRGPNWHSILFPLWDTLTEKKILALKLMRTSIMKANLFTESSTPDVEHYQRLKSQGHICIHDYINQGPIGDHVVAGDHFCYHKYRDVYQTYRSHNFEWDSGAFLGGEDLRERAKAHFNFFLYKWAMTENTDYLYSIAGMMDGILSPIEHKSKSLESHEYMIDKNYGIEAYWKWQIDEVMKYSNGVLL